MPKQPGLTQNDIWTAYQQILGRQPTQAEINSFMQYGNNGSVNLSPINVQQILQGTPEYQQSQLMNQGQTLTNTLGQSDQRMLGIAQGQVGQQFASSGVGMGSSGYVNAFAQAAANLAMQRQQTLANFYSPGFQAINANSMAQGNNQLAFGQGQQESTVGWRRQLELAQMQADQMKTLNRENQQQQIYGTIFPGQAIMSSYFGGRANAGSGTAGGGGAPSTGYQTGQMASWGGGGGNGGYGSQVGSNNPLNLFGGGGMAMGRQATY